MQLLVHDASLGDAAAIASIHARAWQSAYRGMLPDALLDSISVAERARRWAQRLQARDAAPLPFTIVARDDRHGELLGFCAVARMDDDAAATVGALYVDPGQLRRGVGGSLMTFALGRLEEEGLGDVVLWVLAANTGARAFYAHFGFADDGARATFEGAPEIRMRASLASSGFA